MHGLYLLWWVEERHIPAALVAAVLAAGDLVVMLVELPTGWLADRYGHKISLVIGSVLQVAGILACWFAPDRSGLLAASVLIALGDAFRSGAGAALLYRSCVALDRTRTFQTIEARTGALERVGLIGLVLAGGAIVETWGFAAGWIAEASLSAVGLVLACAMTEPPAAPASPDEGAPGASRRVLIRTFALVVLPAAAVGAAASAGSFIVQTSGGEAAIGITIFVAAAALAEAAGSWVAMRIPSGGARQQTNIAAIGLLLVLAAVAMPAVFTPVVLALAFLGGAADPLRAGAIQRLAPDGARARAASLASACDMAVSTLMLPLAGLWRGR